MSVAGRNTLQWRTNFVKTSKCRQCGITLRWGDRRYAFDHKDNNHTNNNQSKCYLVCRNCHGYATLLKKKKNLHFIGSTLQNYQKESWIQKTKEKNIDTVILPSTL